MNRTLVRYLLWMLIAVLPLQSWAAARNAGCGSTSGGASSHVPSDRPSGADMAAHHAEARATSNCAEAAEAASASHADHGDHPGRADHANHAGCGGCCTGCTAPPAMPPMSGGALMSCAVRVTPPSSATGYIPGGLERPPRAAV